MVRMPRISTLVLLLAVGLIGCGDSPTSPGDSPTGPGGTDERGGTAAAAGLGNAQTATSIKAQIRALYNNGNRGMEGALDLFDFVANAIPGGNRITIEDAAFRFVDHVLGSLTAGELVDPNGSQPPTLDGALAALIADLYSFAGISATPPPPAAFGPDGAAVVLGSGGGLVVTGTQSAGAEIPAGTFQNRTLVTIVRLMNPTQPGQGPLPTNLQQFPLFYDIDASSAPTSQFVAAVCVLDNPPDPLGAPPGIVGQLRLAHPDLQNPGSIQILPLAPSPFLSCVSADGAPAADSPGGLGGLATSFSPFGAVLPQSGPPMTTPADSARALIQALVPQPASHGDLLELVQEIETLLAAGDNPGAEAVAVFIIDIMLGRQAAGSLSDPNGSAPPTVPGAVSDLIAQLYMLVGIMMPPPPPGAFDPDGAAEVVDQNGGLVVTSTMHAGVEVPPGAFSGPTLVTIVRLPNPTQAAQGPLPTTLQQFPQFYEVMASAQPTQGGPGVVVGVCVLDPPHPLAPPAAVLSQLRLAHPDPSNPTQVDILPLAPVPFLDCSSATSSLPAASALGTLASATLDQLGRWASPAGRFVGVGTLAANAALNPGGLGGLATSFSPFGAVLPPGGPNPPATPADSARILIQALVTNPNTLGTLLGQVATIETALLAGNTQAAQDEAVSIMDVVLGLRQSGSLADPNASAPPTTDEAVVDLIDQLYTLTGITMPPPPLGALAPDGAAQVVGPSGGTVVTSTMHAGVDVPPGAFPNPTLVTIVRLPNPSQTGQGPLPTALQQYPQFYEIMASAQPAVGGPGVVVGVCVLDPPHPLAPPPAVTSQLRLAHEPQGTPGQIDILPLAATPFLDCSTATSSLPSANAFGALASALDELGRWASPAGRFAGVGTLGAANPGALNPGGLGGLATSFSPFGAVVPPSTGPASPADSARILIQALVTQTGGIQLAAQVDVIEARLAANDTQGAQDEALSIINSILSFHRQGSLTDPNGSQAPTIEEAIIDLVGQLYTLSGITAPPPPLGSLAPDGAVAVIGPLGGLVLTSTLHAGVDIPAGVFTNPTLVTIQRLPNPAQNGQGPLPTSLQQFPQFYDITSSAAPGGQIEVGLCVLDQPHPLAPPASVVGQLRLAHPDPQNPQQVEILALAPASFLDCSTATSSLPSNNTFKSLASATLDHLGRWTSPAGRFVGVGTVVAGSSNGGLNPGGLGGLATSFSPFGTVLPQMGGSNLTQLGPDILGEAPGDRFGHSSTISDDGSRIAVGASQNAGGGSNSGSVRAFEWNGNAWVQLGQDIDGVLNRFTGEEGTIALSGDGTRLAVGSWRFNGAFGRVRVFEFTGSSWTLVGQELTFLGGQIQLGRSVSLSTDGNTLAVGAPQKSTNGAAMIYDLVGSTWTQRGSDILGQSAVSGERFGQAISISADGNRVAIGAARGIGLVRVFDWTGQNWVQVGSDMNGEPGISQFGWFVHMSRDGMRVAATAHGFNSGYVKVHELVGSSWVQMGPVFNQANFGYQTVSLSSDGSRFVLGDPNDGNSRGAFQVLDWTGASWLQVGMDVVGLGASDQFGRSVAISADGTRVVSGAWIRPTPGTVDQRGAASVFQIP